MVKSPQGIGQTEEVPYCGGVEATRTRSRSGVKACLRRDREGPLMS